MIPQPPVRPENLVWSVRNHRIASPLHRDRIASPLAAYSPSATTTSYEYPCSVRNSLRWWANSSSRVSRETSVKRNVQVLGDRCDLREILADDQHALRDARRAADPLPTFEVPPRHVETLGYDERGA